MYRSGKKGKKLLKRIAKITGISETVPRRVLHLSTAHPWTDNRIHWREASSLVSAGYDVGLYAVAGTENHSSAVKVSTMHRKPRFQRMTVGTMHALHVALHSKAELVHLHDPELIWLIPLLRLSGREVIYDAHEDLPTQVIDKQYIPCLLRRVTSSVAVGLLRVAGAASSQVVAATETIAKRFDKEKTVVVRNFPQLNDASDKNSDVRRRAHYAVYVGGISADRGCGTVLDAFGSPNLPKGWQLLMAGSGSDAYLEQLQKKPGWNNVQYAGQVSSSKARHLIAQSRVGIVTLHNTAAYRDSLPTKMFEYMAEGTAVIASDFPLWRAIVEKYNCGLLVDENSPDALAAALDTYTNDEALLSRHSRNGMRAAKEVLNWESEAQHLLRAYNHAFGRKSANEK